jgi:hypothetical protein
VEEVRRKLGVPVHPLVTVRDILEASPSIDLDGRPAIGGDAKERMLSYMAEYCV